MNIGECELHRLYLKVQAVGRIDRKPRKIEIFEYAQRHQRGDALAVGWNLQEPKTAIVDPDRLHPIIGVRGEIVQRQCRAALFCVRCNFFRELAAVERFAFGLGDLFQRARLRREGEFLSRFRCAPARHEGLGKPRLRFEFRHLVGPQACDGG
ncbi:hypothetical protein D3C83_25180 [compost metagenome]